MNKRREVMEQPQHSTLKYSALFAGIDEGNFKLPKFQRDFVWTKGQTAKLLDSMIKGYPIGTFILWRTDEELRAIKNIGNSDLPELPKGHIVSYVLDGQQRITSLYAVRKGSLVDIEGEVNDFRDIYIDLSLPTEEQGDSVVTTETEEGKKYISIFRLLNENFTDLMDEFDREHLRKIEVFKSRLTGYDFPIIILDRHPLDIACEVFTRINTGGTELTLFEIMTAKTYDVSRGFDLGEKYNAILDNPENGKDLSGVEFETLPPETVLQCVAACLAKNIRKNDILRLNKIEFINKWDAVIDALFWAVDFLRGILRIQASRLLPYNGIIVPLVYFFYKNGRRNPKAQQTKMLNQFFWRVSLSERYSFALESKIAGDLKIMDSIIKGSTPKYSFGEDLNFSFEDLKKCWFSTSRAFCKTLLCLYAYFEPKSFKDKAMVRLDNEFLKKQNSKNFHHFFPKSFLKKKGYEPWEANSILNITLIPDYLNKREIRGKAPSIYMKKFRKENPEIADTMKSHLIDDLDDFGVWENDYDTFLEARAKKVIKEIEKRLKTL
jgi:hypothetical protein